MVEQNPRLFRRDFEFLPGHAVPHTGMYRCISCMGIQTLNAGAVFPNCPNCREHCRSWSAQNRDNVSAI